MPIFEFFCNKCKKKFETLLMGDDKPSCPECKGNDLEKLFSTFASPGLDGPSHDSSCSCCSPKKSCSDCH